MPGKSGLAYSKKLLISEFLRNLLFVATGWLAGNWLGHPLTGLALGLIVSLAYLYLKLFRYYSWINGNEKYRVSESNDLFSSLYGQVSRSITEQNTLIEKQEFILNLLPDSIILLDTRNTIIWLNQTATDLLGATRQGVINKPISLVLRHPDLNRLLKISNLNQPVEFDSPLDPQTRLSASIVGFREDLRILLIRDISKLHGLETTRQEFISSASHELRTPLAVISGYLESIENMISPDLKTPLATMREQSRRMEHIIDDLLLLARLEIQPHQIEHLHKPVNIRTLLGKIEKEAIAISAGKQNIVFQCNTDVMLNGIEKELHSAFSNLVQNAIKYSPQGGTIAVRWHKQDDTAVFEVEDNGPGIEKEHLPLLTERFYRVNISRSRDTGGTGLGLSIVNQVLKRHDSRLSIQSTPGKGSLFTCTFTGNRLA
ncbi:MAG: phosphate regulon sensor histidine kinase PhoR [Gammaproteobacteria bacterium]|nr:MAG: phosphate regulon sensor histidine kinase PhoR [Gammaproteobacteria bacterium]